ncbi:MAG: ABC transporter permease [Planctomycetota bacterium]
MDFLVEGLRHAWRLVVTGDRDVIHAVFVTLLCTLSATTLAALLAFPYGAWLGIHRRRGQGLQVFLMRVGMFTPTVVVGLLVYGMLSRRGLLGSLDLLYTKSAIVIGEFLLAFPLMVTLVHGSTAVLPRIVPETARTLGASRFAVLRTVLGEVRVGLVAAYLAALARCLSELGVALTVGGNLRFHTRTLASTITLELGKGEFGTALASGILLLVLAGGAALLAHGLSRETHR